MYKCNVVRQLKLQRVIIQHLTLFIIIKINYTTKGTDHVIYIIRFDNI